MNKVKVTNTTDMYVEFFDTIQEANDYVNEQIDWFDSVNKNLGVTPDYNFVIEIKRLTEFTVEVKETLSKLVKVYATDEDEARQVAMKQYDNEEIVLERGDLMATEFINI